MVPALDSQSGLFARLTPCLRGVSGVKKANMDARLEARAQALFDADDTRRTAASRMPYL